MTRIPYAVPTTLLGMGDDLNADDDRRWEAEVMQAETVEWQNAAQLAQEILGGARFCLPPEGR